MRLLRTDTIDLLPLDESRPSKYAILSHTWGKDEVLFEDILNGHPENKPAYDKVKSACRRAAADGYSCIWIDNCCIDKSSSAELSEAINSMYAWYQEADVCYAYFADVDATAETDSESEDFKNRLASSKWFKRGWTLQELIAPCRMIFFARDWTVIGKKMGSEEDVDLGGVLSSITRIDEDILKDPQRLHLASAAKRMSWAAGRETTCPEDLAYCLMGIFSVNMPMLYGEGGVKAFLRLQEEIMKQSDDQTLFAWTLDDTPDSVNHGLLATSPSVFKNSREIMPYEDYAPRAPFQMTNRGLSIELPLSRLDDNTWVAGLDCPVPPAYPDHSFLAVYLQRLSVDSDQYARKRIGRLTQVSKLGARQTIYVCQALHNPISDQRPFPRHIFQLRNAPSPEHYRTVDFVYDDSTPPPPRLTTSRVYAQQGSLPGPATFSIAKGAHQLTVAIILQYVSDGELLTVMLGSSVDFCVGYNAAALSDIKIDMQKQFESFYSYFQARAVKSVGCIELENHDVRVNIDSKISGANKYYMVDVEVVAKVRTPKLLDLLVDSVSEEMNAREQVGRAKSSIWAKMTTRTKRL